MYGGSVHTQSAELALEHAPEVLELRGVAAQDAVLAQVPEVAAARDGLGGQRRERRLLDYSAA